jgi:hypothetical protein
MSAKSWAMPGEIEEAYQETEALALENEDPTFRPVFMSTNAITLSDKIQIVLRFYGEADTIHENYDFVHCTNYWTSKAGELVLRQPALESLCRASFGTSAANIRFAPSSGSASSSGAVGSSTPAKSSRCCSRFPSWI